MGKLLHGQSGIFISDNLGEMKEKHFLTLKIKILVDSTKSL
jgi:hypothetical protein